MNKPSCHHAKPHISMLLFSDRAILALCCCLTTLHVFTPRFHSTALLTIASSYYWDDALTHMPTQTHVWPRCAHVQRAQVHGLFLSVCILFLPLVTVAW